MTVQQVITLAENSELRSLGSRTDTDAILGYINLGMIELYKRFVLSTNEVIITLGVDGDVDNPYTMISDTLYKLPSDYMKILAAYEEVPTGSTMAIVELPINEEENVRSINTVSWDTVQIPLSTDGAYISIIYKDIPVQYSNTPEDLGANIALPVQVIEALLHYIGYRAHAAVTGEIQAENTTHYTRFEASCNKVRHDGMLTGDDLGMATRLYTRGFV